MSSSPLDAYPSFVTRFAPSPTGRLHPGHAWSAWVGWAMAQRTSGKFILRIEDIDPVRCQPQWTDQILHELSALGLHWTGEVWKQSERMSVYLQALQTLQDEEWVYPCFCTRKEIMEEIRKASSAPHGIGTNHYPGTCKKIPPSLRRTRIERGDKHSWRLDSERAFQHFGSLTWTDLEHGEQVLTQDLIHDDILARKDFPTSYHLSVVIDDAAQGVTLITRGEDLFSSTPLHVLIQHLLGLPTPLYLHHSLIRDDQGERFAKRNQSQTLEVLRQEGAVFNLSPASFSIQTARGKIEPELPCCMRALEA